MRKSFVWLVASLASLCGCGGGGGGTNSAGTVPFTSFSAIQPNQSVVMTGMSQSADGTGDFTHVSALTINGADTASTSATASFDSAVALSGVSLSSPQVSVSLNKSNGTVSCVSSLCDLFNSNAEVVVMNAPALGWNYQTFGVWDRTISGTNFQVGAFSVGAVTPGSAVPVSGISVFSGLATGFFVDTGGTPYVTSATMAASVDFSARSIFFTTGATTRADLATATPVSDTGLNITGTLTYAPGTNQFSGSVTTANTNLSGTATGRFYGPGAQEIGGLYSLTGTGGSMLGGFGGKR